jgi:hypothetical protein
VRTERIHHEQTDRPPREIGAEHLDVVGQHETALVVRAVRPLDVVDPAEIGLRGFEAGPPDLVDRVFRRGEQHVPAGTRHPGGEIVGVCALALSGRADEEREHSVRDPAVTVEEGDVAGLHSAGGHPHDAVVGAAAAAVGADVMFRPGIASRMRCASHRFRHSTRAPPLSTATVSG